MRSLRFRHARRRIVRGWACCAGLGLLVAAGSAQAQVSRDVTFRGRLVDAAGTPQSGPVDLELRVFDADTTGTDLYAELHTGVPLDETGAFAVQLGLGKPLSGTFDADLFSDADRWLDVVVAGEVLTKGQIIASVPWALIAQQAKEIAPHPNGPFEDCGDGTVTDSQTGLLWEKKTGTSVGLIFCEVAGCPDPHDVNNAYEWSNTGMLPDGGAFTDFLDKLNDPTFAAAATRTDVTGCFVGHCDWRLPTIAELRTIYDAGCSGNPCIDPIFGPTATTYWAASTQARSSVHAWEGTFLYNGVWWVEHKSGDWFVRAVRAGSCH